jgi:hypothetical protein
VSRQVPRRLSNLLYSPSVRKVSRRPPDPDPRSPGSGSTLEVLISLNGGSSSRKSVMRRLAVIVGCVSAIWTAEPAAAQDERPIQVALLSPSARPIERLLEIRDDVRRRLEPGGHPHETRRDADSQPLLLRHLGVGRGIRMRYDRPGVA